MRRSGGEQVVKPNHLIHLLTISYHSLYIFSNSLYITILSFSNVSYAFYPVRELGLFHQNLHNNPPHKYHSSQQSPHKCYYTVAHSSPQSATVGHSRLQRIPHSVTRLAEREPTRRPRFARYGDRPAAVGTGARGRTGATAAAAARRRAPWPAGSRPCSAAERRATASRASRAGGGPSRRTCQRDPVRASLSDGRVVRLRRGKAGPAG